MASHGAYSKRPRIVSSGQSKPHARTHVGEIHGRARQVEVWFSILQGQSLSGASFTNLKQLEQHIDAYIKAYNDKAEPFVWTKRKVWQRRSKDRRITQL
jgi:hypothetical protein